MGGGGGGGSGEEDRMKNRKVAERKRVGVKYFDKRKYCVGTEPGALVYRILVTSTTTGLVAQWLVHLLHKQKVGGSIPSCGKSFFFPQALFLSYLSNLLLYVSGQVSN